MLRAGRLSDGVTDGRDCLRWREDICRVCLRRQEDVCRVCLRRREDICRDCLRRQGMPAGPEAEETGEGERL